MKNIELIREVTQAAAGRWSDVLTGLNISVPDSPRKHAPCPVCGGKDRFRFDDGGRGSFICNQCGAGDGLDLIQKVHNCNATEAAVMVADVLSIDYRAAEHDDTASQRNDQREAERRKREQERWQQDAAEAEKRRASFSAKYQALVAKSTPGQSAYLTAKGLEYPLPLLPDGSLLVALTNDDGAVTGAQIIKPDGEKRLVAGTVKKGAFFTVNMSDNPETVIIGEGLATVLSVHLMRPDAMAVTAIDAGNLLPVAKVMRRKYPDAQIIIAADNDIKPGEPNTGRDAAEKAAKSISGWLTLPPGEHKADWNDYHQANGLEAATAAFNDSMYQPEDEKLAVKLKAIEGGKKRRSRETHIQGDKDDSEIRLNQMVASQRGAVLIGHYGGNLAIHPDSDIVHNYNGVIWEPLTDKDLCRELTQIFINAEAAYSENLIKSAVDTMKLSLPVMGATARNLIGFSNGVFDTRTGQFRQHSKEDWLLIASELPFSQPAEGETLATHAPNFWKWLRRSAGNNERKADRILAALFMVLANRYDWQLFIEVTGPGGGGKSIMAETATMLAGRNNTVSANMKALEEARERALLVGYSLIILPDMTRYAGDGAGIKAITGGDKVAIDPKHKAPYSTRIQAVVLAVNNNAMSFSDRSGGISRRRVIFNFPEVVPENERDPMLPEKIEGELAVVIRHLLTRFADHDEAKRLLYEQRKSEEALAIKRESDSLVDFCGYLIALLECEGMIVGNAEMVPFSPRRYLYHAYLAYMSAHGLGKPVSLTRFGTDMPGAMSEYGKEYKRRQCTKGADKGRTISNVLLDDDADGWLPAATGNNDSRKG